MDIKFQVAKPANYFHLLESLSLWDGDKYTRENVRKPYDFVFGLSEDDMSMLKLYQNIRTKHQWGELDSDFIPPWHIQEALQKVEERLTPTDYTVLNEVLKYFSKNFEEMYERIRPRLHKRKDRLEEETTKHDVKGIVEEMSTFYGASDIPEVVTAHLLLNSCDGMSGGGANVYPKEHVTVEPVYLGNDHESHLVHDLCTLGHEIAHVVEYHADPDKRAQLDELKKKKGIGIERGRILVEAINHTLFPKGDLSYRYGLWDPMSNPRQISSNVMKKGERSTIAALANEFYSFTVNALKSGHSIFDDDYLEKATEKLISMIDE